MYILIGLGDQCFSVRILCTSCSAVKRLKADVVSENNETESGTLQYYMEIVSNLVAA